MEILAGNEGSEYSDDYLLVIFEIINLLATVHSIRN